MAGDDGRYRLGRPFMEKSEAGLKLIFRTDFVNTKYR